MLRLHGFIEKMLDCSHVLSSLMLHPPQTIFQKVRISELIYCINTKYLKSHIEVIAKRKGSEETMHIKPFQGFS